MVAKFQYSVSNPGPGPIKILGRLALIWKPEIPPNSLREPEIL